ncbi:hypothetical protein [Pendulispora albinea]|uniref:Fe2OG dioxygenase domain-containing protein n=1 Tax=Pendulispora albinea TaxID=2741071 RepID=A0ABZ2LW28_9BACT
MAPRPGRSLAKRRISRAHEPELYAALSLVLRDPTSELVAKSGIAHLRKAGILVRANDKPIWPRYACLSKRPTPSGFGALPRGAHEKSSLAARLSYLPPAAIPLLANPVYFARPPDAVIADPVTGLPFPYWLGHRTGTTQAAPRPCCIDIGILRAISRVAPGLGRRDVDGARRAWKAFVVASRRHLHENGFTNLSGVIPSLHLASLRRYGRALVRGGFLEWNEDERRLWRHGDGVASVFHHVLTPLVATLAGEEIEPSYTFLSAFRRGGILRKHTDRAQCEYTVSLLLDFEPFSRGIFPWPIVLELPPAAGKPRRVTIRQRIGDMLVFRGQELPHRRPRLRAGSAIHLLFHYVKSSFRGSRH